VQIQFKLFNFAPLQVLLAQLGCLFTHQTCSTTDFKVPQHLDNGFTINASQHSDHFYWIKPWIETFWAQCSGTECWLSPLGQPFTYGRCSTTDAVLLYWVLVLVLDLYLSTIFGYWYWYLLLVLVLVRKYLLPIQSHFLL